jgi:RNA polymerase sigma-70 factor (ECF subfamily)
MGELMAGGTSRLIEPSEAESDGPLAFDTLYEREFAFAWRNLRRLGVPENQLRDAAQDVFLVVHRRLPEFEGRGTVRAWLYSIVLRVAAQHRRTRRRKELGDTEDAELVEDTRGAGPEHRAEQNQSLRRLIELLEQLDEGKREVFILANLEGMTAPEIASALELKLNTVYSRLRAARRELREALAQRTLDEGGHDACG